MSIPANFTRGRGVLRLVTFFLACGLVPCVNAAAAEQKATRWVLDDSASVGGHTTEVLGAPRVSGEPGAKALCFNGISDGVIVPVNPIEDWPQFTVEILFKPDGTGPEEQRFLHIQDERSSRALIETRVTKDKQWALDTFLFVSDPHKLTLLDRTKLHPTDQWHWVALVYDGTTMRHFVNGVKELEGEVAIPAMTNGRISLGVRQNKVYWFKGCIREVRFSPVALDAKALQQTTP